MSVATVLIVFLAVYILSTILLQIVTGSIFEGIFVSTVIMIIMVAGFMYYHYIGKNLQGSTEISEIGSVEVTKKDLDPSAMPANTQ